MIIKAVLFDLYGTLLDIVVDEASEEFWSALKQKYGFTASPTELRQSYLRRVDVDPSREGLILTNVFEDMLRNTGLKPSNDDVTSLARDFRSLSIISLTVRPYTRPLLEHLRRSSVRLGLVSNTEAVLTAYDLDQTKIGEFFDVILLSSDLGIKKPDKRVFDSALRSLNASKQNTVFIGDNLTDDIEGARRAGLRSIYVMNQPRSPLTMFGSDKEMVRASQPTLEGILGALDSFESVE